MKHLFMEITERVGMVLLALAALAGLTVFMGIVDAEMGADTPANYLMAVAGLCQLALAVGVLTAEDHWRVYGEHRRPTAVVERWIKDAALTVIGLFVAIYLGLKGEVAD